MAERDDAQERTEQPSAKRLQDAREKGQIARSRELTTMFVLLGGAATLYLSGNHFFSGLGQILSRSFALSRPDIFSVHIIPLRALELMLDALIALAPILLMAVVVALLAPLALGGWNISAEALLPKFERLDPIKGLQRVFGARGLVEMLKALAKFALVLVFTVAALRYEQADIMTLAGVGVEAGAARAAGLLFQTFLVVSLATVIVAAIDVPFQLWQHGRQLRMSRQELKDEMKETDGSPEMKSRIRSLQQEVARRRMMEEVPKADVIITNPEHYAVALKFDPDRMAAPLVVAKGVDEVAANIRAVGDEHNVMRFAAPPLARALYYTTKLNHEIPAGLYVAVARVLAYVFQLRDGVVNVPLPTDLPIPDEYVH